MATPEEMAASMKANLKAKTGRTLEQWLRITKAAKLEKHGQIVQLLKAEHGVTHGFANLIAHETLGGGAAGDPVAAQYAGRKAALKPIYDALLVAARKLGKDVEIAPKKTYVSLRRNKQFALIQPSTATRVDVGLCLKGKASTGRLEESGSWSAMCSHRVRIGSRGEVDAELRRWLKEAYEAS